MEGPTMDLGKIKVISVLDGGDKAHLEGAEEWTIERK